MCYRCSERSCSIDCECNVGGECMYIEWISNPEKYGDVKYYCNPDTCICGSKYYEDD